MEPTPRAHALWPLVALGAVIVITVGWWAAALWPLPASTPEWVLRARAACFGSSATGAPNSGGWILLIGTPLTMLAALGIMAGGEVRMALRHAVRARAGRVWVTGTAVTLAGLMAAAGVRVSGIYGYGSSGAEALATPPDAPLARSNAAPGPLHLVDQTGARFDSGRYRGRPVIVTFAYGKCETVCPIVVHDARVAQEATRELGTALVVVTLDPWRDTPGRLPSIARSWELGADAHLLGGEVAEVEAALDGWEIERRRDPRTGEIAHPSLAFVIDREGRVAYALAGGRRLEEAIRALPHGPAPRT